MPVQVLKDAGFFSDDARLGLEAYVFKTVGAHPERSGMLPFYYAAALQGNSSFNPTDSTGLEFRQATKGTDVILSGFPNALYERLPLQDHVPCSPHHVPLSSIQQAFSLLGNCSMEGQRFTTEYVRLLVVVEQTAQSVSIANTTLTSCSLPVIPYCSFISTKALIHLPPKEIAVRPHHAWLAENVFHEAIHNALTVNILAGRIFVPTFRACDAPAVAIPWRADDVQMRNRYWPIDRVLHALLVYVGVYCLRVKMLNSDLDDMERTFLQTTLHSARISMRHLSDALRSSPAFFTKPANLAIRKVCQFIDSTSDQIHDPFAKLS
jgi:hypothetical protein